uniref:Uncharacterized protein n=1 Tax=Knipowitschia caucasica TaxID=637954 RepID=A0AAV2JV93_KNICA
MSTSSVALVYATSPPNPPSSYTLTRASRGPGYSWRRLSHGSDTKALNGESCVSSSGGKGEAGPSPQRLGVGGAVAMEEREPPQWSLQRASSHHGCQRSAQSPRHTFLSRDTTERERERGCPRAPIDSPGCPQSGRLSPHAGGL